MIGDSTIVLADRKPDWPFTPTLLQIYISDARAALDRATDLGATVVTPVSAFYGGYDLARIEDP